MVKAGNSAMYIDVLTRNLCMVTLAGLSLTEL